MNQPNRNSSPASASQNPNSELDFFIMAAVFLFLAYILFAIIMQYFAFLARYLYYPIVAPVWWAGEGMGRIGSGSVLFACSLLFGLWWAKKKFTGEKKGSIYLMTAFCIYITLTIIEFVIGHENSFLTSHVKMYCNPSNPNGLLYITSCQNKPADIAAHGTLALMIASLFPNLIISIPAIAEVIGGMIRLGQHPKARATTVFNVRSLIKFERELYPHLLIYEKIDLNEVDGKSGQMRLMDDGRRLCFENDLVDAFVKRPTKASIKFFGENPSVEDAITDIKQENIPTDDLVPQVNDKRFEQLALKQLGLVFSGVETLNAGQIILLAINLPRACSFDPNIAKAFWLMSKIEGNDNEEEIEQAKIKLDKMGDGLSNLSKAQEIEKKHVERISEVQRWVAQDITTEHSLEDIKKGLYRFPKIEEYRKDIEFWLKHEISQRMLEEHAYINTFLYRVLKDAKRLGVCQPSNFRWLKFYDRDLWAIVQNVDRPSAFAENIGTVSHYMIERKEGSAVYQPMIQAAYNGLLKNITAYKYTKDQVDAWYYYQKTGDKRPMYERGMISKQAIQRN